MQLIIFDRILSCTKSLSDCFQSKQVDLADLVSATMSVLKTFRSEEEWIKVFNYAESVAKINNINLDSGMPRLRPRRPPAHLDSSVVFESVGVCESYSTSYQYKVNIYYPVIDAFLTELGRHFSDKNVEILSAISAVNPNSPSFLDYTLIEPLANSYNLTTEKLQSKLMLARHSLKINVLKNLGDILLQLAPLQGAFPTLFNIVKIAVTISVSTAECERSFSTLKRVITYLRSSMTEERLNNLVVLSIEEEETCKLSFDDIVDNFAKMDKNRRILLC